MCPHLAFSAIEQELLKLSNARRTLGADQVVLDGLDLQVSAGEAVSIIGRSGSGKSTLLAGLGLISPFDSGTEYTLNSVAVPTLSASERAQFRGTKIGFILQNSGLVAHLSAVENVRLPLLHAGRASLAEAKSRALAALAQFGTEHLAQRKPTQLSGGERQRVAIARALVTNPDLILADEPTGALDEATGNHVLDELLDAVSGSGKALVIVTHDLAVAKKTHRIMQLTAGRLETAKADTGASA